MSEARRRLFIEGPAQNRATEVRQTSPQVSFVDRPTTPICAQALLDELRSAGDKQSFTLLELTYNFANLTLAAINDKSIKLEESMAYLINMLTSHKGHPAFGYCIAYLEVQMTACCVKNFAFGNYYFASQLKKYLDELKPAHHSKHNSTHTPGSSPKKD